MTGHLQDPKSSIGYRKGHPRKPEKWKVVSNGQNGRQKQIVSGRCFSWFPRNGRAQTLRLISIHLLIILIIYIFTFSVILPVFCNALPYSFYYNANRDRDLKSVIESNQNRILEDEQYLQTLDPRSTLRKYTGENKNVHITIGVISVDRTKHKQSNSNPKYLTQVLSRLDQGLTQHSFDHVNKLFICNVDANPSHHSEAVQLSKYFPMVTKSAFNVEAEQSRVGRGGLRNRLAKEKGDYVFCLNHSKKYNSKYVLLVQDDAIPNIGFYERLNYLLEYKLEHQYVQGNFISNEGKWAFLKLNFPTPLAAFHRHWWFVCEGIAIATLGAGVVAFMYEHCYRRQRREMNLMWTYFIFSLSFLYFGISSNLIGRQYFVQLHGLSNYWYEIRPGTSCCIAAVLYPSNLIPNITNYLQNEKSIMAGSYPVDFALADFVTISKMKQYITVPNVFTHIGMFSSLHVESVNSVQFYQQ
ncbi:GPI-N-acetylgalactosamine transferase PGAP4-like [Glandiceps talaboti]